LVGFYAGCLADALKEIRHRGFVVLSVGEVVLDGAVGAFA
jgi:hypothetical protein